ncbi:RNA polymerase III transcription factor IIIC subunit-domain-containing protein [Aspergillus karnatakaensis]|uniref:transcription factor TFIIIC subunit TFC1 n=1 Tax=Aspergillus karnatakaensis TaxID=1810916 RepID=UPI003CCDA3D8
MAENNNPRTAPFYNIPSRRIVSIEHPAIVKNVDKAIETLQGTSGITKTLNPPKPDTPANLVLRPEDVMSRPLQSTSTQSNNILLKVTVLKRTGRKRKRGSSEPFMDDPAFTEASDGPPRPTAREVLRSLRDNAGRYQVEPVGLVERTHVFRGMPDFVYSTTNSPFVTRFRSTILPFSYQKMKQFDLDMSKGATTNADLIPPPSFSHGDIPFNYFYHQNPTVRQTLDTKGNITTINTQTAAKVLTHLVPYDIPSVPSAPRPNCPPIETLDKTLQATIALVQARFDAQPAWTRRALRNSLPQIEQRYALRYAIPYCGYIFRSGPWRDAIVAFGKDPRLDPTFRIYQTTMFRILPRDAELARDKLPSLYPPNATYTSGGRRHTLPRPNELTPEAATTTTSHLFSGKLPLSLDGRMWMFCDITDPLLLSIIVPSTPLPENFLREKCEITTDGWYGNGTLAKLKAVMRQKILALYANTEPSDGDFQRVLQFPDYADPDTGMAEFWLDPAVASGKEMALATEIRGTIKGSGAWRELVKERNKLRSKGKGKGKAVAAVAEEEEDEGDGQGESEGEGEEAEMEQAEMMEAAAEAVDVRGNDDGDDEE